MRMANVFTSARTAMVLAGVALVALASTASAFNLRSPQVVLNGASVSGVLAGQGNTINVDTDQLDAQAWTSTASGNATFTLVIELAGNAASNNIGVYNAGAASPTLYQVFPGAATAGWFATCHFTSTGGLTVLLFDDNAVFQGSTAFTGVDRTNFGFYLQGPGGTFYSQDYRNAGGNAQMLTYAGNGINLGEYYECFEDLPYSSGDADFQDAILDLQSVNPTPTHTQTWGALKATYR